MSRQRRELWCRTLLTLALPAGCVRANDHDIALPGDAAAAGDTPVADAPVSAPGVDGAGGAVGPAGGDGPAIDGAGEVATADPFVPIAGTRLKARWYQGAGASPVFKSWYDSELGQECFFQLDANGDTRCLPSNVYDHQWLWADSACTVPVTSAVYQRPCDPPVNLAPLVRVPVTPSSKCSPSRWRVFSLGAPYRGPFFSTQGPGCQSENTDLTRGPYYMAGAELPPERFVKAREVARPLPDRAASLAPLIIEAEDGARGLNGWQEAATGLSCLQFFPGAGGNLLCTAKNVAITVDDFVDQQCQVRAAVSYSSASTCGGPATGAMVASNTCPTTYSPVFFGAQLPQYYTFLPDCVPIALPATGGAVAYALGAAMPDPPALARTVEDSSDRLRRVFSAAAAGRRVQERLWFDAQRSELCTPQVVSGVTRCLPEVGFDVNNFEDAGCTRPLARASGCHSPLGRQDLPMCRQAFFRLGNEYTGPVFTRDSVSAACTPFDRASSALRSDFYQPIPVPETDFVALTVQ